MWKTNEWRMGKQPPEADKTNRTLIHSTLTQSEASVRNNRFSLETLIEFTALTSR